MQMEADAGTDIITALRSDLAGLQYKREKLISEVSELVNLIYRQLTVGFVLSVHFYGPSGLYGTFL